MQSESAKTNSKELILTRQFAADVPDMLCGDAIRLKQILNNFVSNAVKFSDRGEITVRARTIEEDTRGVLLRFEVTDQGNGLSPEQQARLFVTFTQGDDSSTRSYGGAGLGLAISKRIALLMGGDAGVISQEGYGSTFWATVRLKRANTEAIGLEAGGR
jgi:signal transduction histidine kinase